MFDLDPFVANTPISKDPTPPNKSLSPLSLPDTSHHEDSGPVSTRAQNLALQYHDYSQNINPRDDGHNYFDCPKVWERIVSHPRFDDVDVEALLAELNSKVKIVCPPPV
jgi:hypothetical protein